MYSEAMQAAIDRVLAHQTFDVIQLEHQHLGLFHVDSPGAIRILDAHNIESDNIRRLTRYSRSPLRRLYYELEYRKVRREESTVLAGQDALLVTSERDRWLIEEEFPHIPKFVIPNGVDTEFFHPSDQAPEPLSLVFTGAMNYLPNADGIGYFLREIFPIIRKEIPEVHVSVVGSGPPKWLERLADSNVTVTGYVNDVRPFVHRASVYVVPLRMGGGTRLKVLEAMAMKKPVVTTSIGCEGIDVVHNESALIADDPNEFAAAVIELVRNDRRRASIVDRGYDVVREKYEWSVVGDRLAGVYDTLLMKRTRRSVQERV
jgi:glycosyltransferase involved in cell wall biosynthesis